MNKSIKMIVFDMAGTTINEGGLVYKTLFNTINNFGIKIKERDIEKWHGSNKYDVLDYFLKKHNPSNFFDLQKDLHSNFNNNLINTYSNKDNLKLIHPSIPYLFNDIRKNNVKICLNTGYPKDIQESIISSLNMEEFIDDYISSEEVKFGRPYPYMIHQLMERNAIINSKQVIKIGDTPNDILEGLNANCYQSIGVLSGSNDRDKLLKSGASYVVNNVIDIMSLSFLKK